MKWLPLLLLGSVTTACADMPRDQSGTLDRIRAEGVVRVGFVAGAAERHAPQFQALADRAARAAGGRIERVEGGAEPLLLMLEEGELDLVAGEFDSASPWVRRVHLLPPLATERRGRSDVEATVAARNGENGWIMLLEREAKAMGGGA